MHLVLSDIDLVVLGKWDALPLYTLEKALLEKGIADPNTLKVLDKASVSQYFLLYQNASDSYFNQIQLLGPDC